MSIYNTLLVEAKCPSCGYTEETRADFWFGLRDQFKYHLNDKIAWEGRGIRTPKSRPPGGDFVGDAYAVCRRCGREFSILITIRNDVIVSAEVDLDYDDYTTSSNGTLGDPQAEASE